MNNLDVFLEKNYFYAIFRGRIINNVISKYYKDYLNQLNNKKVLEIGCGSGFGTKIIYKYFLPKKIVATDLDPRLIETAKQNVKDSSLIFEVADATKLTYKNNAFDAIFDFGVIHHIPSWKVCLKELYRVLKPGGKIFFYDVPIESFNNFFGRIARMFTLHPYDDMYTKREFVNYLKDIGFNIIIQKSYSTSLVYFVIIAEK